MGSAGFAGIVNLEDVDVELSVATKGGGSCLLRFLFG